MSDRSHPPRPRFSEGVVLLGLAVVTAGVFAATPLDLAAARVFYHPGEVNPWPAAHRVPWSVLYGAAPWITASLVLLGLGMLAAGLVRGGDSMRWRGIFLLLSLVIGPGLVMNFVLKDHWGRPRPRDVTEFSGAATYVPPLVPSREGGASFPCGHCSVGFLYAAGWWIWRRQRRAWARASLVVGLTAGLALGLGRMAAGGHFLSDVIWSGLLALGIAHVLYEHVLRIPTREAAQAGPMRAVVGPVSETRSARASPPPEVAREGSAQGAARGGIASEAARAGLGQGAAGRDSAHEAAGTRSAQEAPGTGSAREAAGASSAQEAAATGSAQETAREGLGQGAAATGSTQEAAGASFAPKSVLRTWLERAITALAVLGGIAVLIALFGTPHGTVLTARFPLASLSRSPRVFEFTARVANVDLVLVDSAPEISVDGELHGFGLPTSALAARFDVVGEADSTLRYSVIQRGWFTDLDGSARIRLPLGRLERIRVSVERGDIRVTDRTHPGIAALGRPVLDLHTGYGRVVSPPGCRKEG